MAKRKLQIVRSEAPGVLGVCEFCKQQFKSMQNDLMAAGEDVKAQFTLHTSHREHVNQADARIVQEAIPDN